MTYHVPTSAIPLLRDPPFVLWLVLLGAAIGYQALRLLRAPLRESSLLERGVLSAALGLGFLQYLAYGLGMAGALRPAAVGIGLLLLSLAFLPTIWHIVRRMWDGVRGARRSPLPRWIAIGSLLMALVLAVALLQALSPPTDSDGLGYHLNAPKRWLTTGRLDYLPTFVHTNAPMGVEMLFTLALAMWSDTAAKLIHFALGVLALCAVYALGRRVRGPAVGFAAAVLVLNSPTGLSKLSALELFTWSNVDLGIALQIACAVLAWALWDRTRARGWLYAAALCAGFAASFKLTGAFVGAALGVLTAIELRREKQPWRVAVGEGLAVVLVSLLPVLPWLVRTWLVTGNPVYPVLSAVFPSQDWSPSAARAFDEYFKYYNWGTSAGAGLSLAARKALRAATLILVLVTGAAAAYRWRDHEGRTLVALATALMAAGVLFTGLYIRLLFPVFPLVYLAVCMAGARPLARSRLLHAALLTLLVVNGARCIRGFYPGIGDALGASTGRMSRDTYLARNTPLAPIWTFANTRMPPDAPILVAALHPAVGILGGLCYYYNQPCYTTDAYHQRRFRMDTWPEFVQDVARDRIQYVVIASGVFYQRVGPPYTPAQNELPFARRLVDTYGRLVFASGDLQIYRLEMPPTYPRPRTRTRTRTRPFSPRTRTSSRTRTRTSVRALRESRGGRGQP